MMGIYMLDENNNPVETDDIAKAMDPGQRRVALDEWSSGGREIRVSTVFLAIDHSFTPGEPLVLWETMTFADGEDELQERYSSHAAALVGHQKALSDAKKRYPDE